MSINSSLKLSSLESTRFVQLLIGLVCIGYFVLRIFKFLFPLINNSKAWHHIPAAETGIDAAEKGDTRRPLLQKIPYDVQKRAIMHKRWLMIGHESQWTERGDYRTFTVAEIPFVVIKSDDGKLRAFHNVCRHRAYPVVRRSTGKSLRLSCKYHGWQYDSQGRLVKAPCFPTDQPEIFDMNQNGLFEIHLKIDSGRFVFVNFATNLANAFPWSDISPSRLRTLDFSTAVEWEIEVDVDWRLASLLPWFVDPKGFLALSWREGLLSFLFEGKSSKRLQYVDDASFICNVGGTYHLLVSALPMDGKKTIIKVTSIPDQASSSPIECSDHFRRRVNAEIRSAIDILRQHRTANTNLDFRQSAIRERLDKFNRHIYHHKTMEKAAGKKINAAVRVTSSAEADLEAEGICSALDGLGVETTPGCLSNTWEGELEW